MSNELLNLQQQINDSLQLLRESSLLVSNVQEISLQEIPPEDSLFTEPSSLLEKCKQICEQYERQKPTIRIIHHVACSGGTLISKCLSAMPNVYLLSEVHPYTDLHMGSGKPKFSPSDIPSLSKYAGIPGIKTLNKEQFLQNIITTHQHVTNYGGTLILRDHTHSDFHYGTIAEKPSLIDALSDHFNIKSVITLRDPIDSYLSLQQNKWLHFSPATFEEYCSRIICMLTAYNDVTYFHYEDFVENPSEILQKICFELEIPYEDSWSNFFDIANVTGDSGRSSTIISARPRRDITPDVQEEIKNSESYKKIKILLHESKNKGTQ
jgi:hypothetical protein